MTKACFKCGVVKPLSDFYRHSKMKDGTLNKCKECTRSDVHGRYVATRPERSLYERHRQQQPKRKQDRLKYRAAHQERYPEKYKARTAVSNAVRDGRLVKRPCESCGVDKAQAHHEDYSRPLDVQWLCFACHCRAHGKEVA